MRTDLVLLSLLLLAPAAACPSAGDDDDDDATVADDDDTGHGDDDDDDSVPTDDDDSAADCPTVEGVVLAPDPMPGTIGPLLIGSFEPANVENGLPAGPPVNSDNRENEQFPVAYRLCTREGEAVVLALLDTNDGDPCTPGDLYGGATVTVPEVGPVLVPDIVLDGVVGPDGCRRKNKPPE